MSFLMVAMVEALGLVALYAAWRGIFGLITAFLFMIVMLALSFHVMARKPMPDATSIRMATAASIIWYGAILAGKLALENRDWKITIAAVFFCLLFSTVAGFATVSVLERPLQYDLEEIE